MAPAWVAPPPLLEPQKGGDRSAAWAAVDQALKDRAWGTAAGGSIYQLWSAIQDLETAYLRQLTGEPQNLATRKGRVEPRAIAPKVGVDGDASTEPPLSCLGGRTASRGLRWRGLSARAHCRIMPASPGRLRSTPNRFPRNGPKP